MVAKVPSAIPTGRSGTLGALLVVATAPSNSLAAGTTADFELDASALPCLCALLGDVDGSQGVGCVTAAMLLVPEYETSQRCKMVDVQVEDGMAKSRRRVVRTRLYPGLRFHLVLF